MDGDPEVQRLTRANRRRSMLLSSLIQTSLLTAAIVLPLFASQTIPGFRNEPRLPAPKGIRIVDAQPPGTTSSTSSGPRPPRHDLLQPIEIPQGRPQIVDDRNDTAQFDAAPLGQTGCAICDPNGIPNLPPGLFEPSERTALPPKAPVPESQPRGPISVSKGVQEARLVHRVDPIYPPIPKQIRQEGTVELRAIIAKDGTVQYLEVISGHPLFIEASKQAVLQWRYQPTLLNGEPVEVDTRITVHFILSR